MHVINWNVRQAKPNSYILNEIFSKEPEVIYLTETYEDILKHEGCNKCSNSGCSNNST